MTSGFVFEESSELEGEREIGVHETSKQRQGRRRASIPPGEHTRKEECGSGHCTLTSGHKTLEIGQSVSRRIHAFGIRVQCLWQPDYM